MQSTGFLPEEREWLDRVLTPPSPSSPPSSPPTQSSSALLVDSWRALHPSLVQYSFWDLKTNARGRNKGWRIDYVLTSPPLHERLLYCAMHPEMTASDHSPVVAYFSPDVTEEARGGAATDIRVLGHNRALVGRAWRASADDSNKKKRAQKTIASFFATQPQPAGANNNQAAQEAPSTSKRVKR